MRSAFRSITIFGIFLLTISACKEKPAPVPVEEIVWDKGVFVVNEGNYNWGNAQLDFIEASDKYNPYLFKDHLQSNLGDVAQSIEVRNQRAYLVVNNSGKIEVIDFSDGLKQVCTIPGLTSPRYIEFASSNKAYVTDLYANAISIVDVGQCAITGQIPVGNWTEELLKVGNEMFVTEMGSSQILIVDISTDQVVDSIAVGREPNSLVLDKNGKLWVLCSGGLQESEGTLFRINPSGRAVELRLDFSDLASSPNSLCIDPAGEQLYFLNDGLFRMEIESNSLPGSAWYAAGSANLYGLDINPITGKVWVSDAKDYVQSGKLFRLNPVNANVEASFDTGIIPGSVAFVN